MRNQANNIVGAAVTIGIAVIVMVLLMLVAGSFVDEVPTNSTTGEPTGEYGTEIFNVRDTGGSAFNLLAVALLVVPAGAIVAYLFRSGLGNFISQGR